MKINLDDDCHLPLELENVNSVISPSPEEQQKLAQERLERIQQYTLKMKKSDGIRELENEPAFVRRKIQLNQVNQSESLNSSRFNISTDANGNVSLKSNNSFLHDNVD